MSGSSPPRHPNVPDGATVYSVSRLAAGIKERLESGFTTIWVEGEVTDLAKPASGHYYFSLRDAKSTLRCAMFRDRVLRLTAGFEPQNGVSVVALGRVSFYEPRGDCQFYAERMFPVGIGAGELQLKQLKVKLQAKGYFDPRRKKPLLPFPRSLCLIASGTGAAVRDMVEILRRRWPATNVAVRPSRVQGEGAAEEIAAAIDQVNRWKSNGLVRVDAMIIGRGGGSSDDLSAFNREVLADAIFRSRIPIVSAVGHEIDTTIADLVADVRASTPSHAAELVVPDREEIAEIVGKLNHRLVQAMRRRTTSLKRRVDDLAQRRVLRQPLERIRDLERRLDDCGDRLRRAMRLTVERRLRDLATASARLESLSPLNVLARGYSLTRPLTSGRLIRSAADVAPGDAIVTELRFGRIISRVESTESASERPG